MRSPALSIGPLSTSAVPAPGAISCRRTAAKFEGAGLRRQAPALWTSGGPSIASGRAGQGAAVASKETSHASVTAHVRQEAARYLGIEPQSLSAPCPGPDAVRAVGSAEALPKAQSSNTGSIAKPIGKKAVDGRSRRPRCA